MSVISVFPSVESTLPATVHDTTSPELHGYIVLVGEHKGFVYPCPRCLIVIITLQYCITCTNNRTFFFVLSITLLFLNIISFKKNTKNKI